MKKMNIIIFAMLLGVAVFFVTATLITNTLDNRLEQMEIQVEEINSMLKDMTD